MATCFDHSPLCSLQAVSNVNFESTNLYIYKYIYIYFFMNSKSCLVAHCIEFICPQHRGYLSWLSMHPSGFDLAWQSIDANGFSQVMLVLQSIFTWLQQLIKLVDFILIIAKLRFSTSIGVISVFSVLHASQKKLENKFPSEWLLNKKIVFNQNISILVKYS